MGLQFYNNHCHRLNRYTHNFLESNHLSFSVGVNYFAKNVNYIKIKANISLLVRTPSTVQTEKIKGNKLIHVRNSL